MAIGIAIGAALGGSFVQEHGRKALPIVIVLTLITGLLIGWGLTGELGAMQGSTDLR
jgi:predicted MFS family arabinose efflux permease